MMLRTCPREKDVAALLRCGHWPQACPPELHAHVAGCRACSDLVAVTMAFQQARSQAAGSARLQPAGALWWRAQLRRRNAALQTIRKPILGAELFAFAVCLCAAALLFVQAGQGRQWLGWLRDLPGALHLDSLWPSSLPIFTGSLWILMPVLATLAIVGGIVVCFGSERQ
ncbi:MAG TPA: hypothetical protein VMV57_13660 [Terracidiphilus sp.]|nr:hypothetical protein [Terracidiphilus sp.]